MLKETNPDRLRLDREEAIALLRPEHFERSMYSRLDFGPGDELPAEATRRPGAARGRITFSTDDLKSLASDSCERDKWILVTEATSPDDIPVMHYAAGYVTQAGGPLAHAALIARKLGKAAVVGVANLRINHLDGSCEFITTSGRGVYLNRGDEISIDGTDGKIFRGTLKVNDKTAEDDIRAIVEIFRDYLSTTEHRVTVYVNADSDGEVEQGLDFGAEGVGLVRTEAMPSVRAEIESLRATMRRSQPLSVEEQHRLESNHTQDFVAILRGGRALGAADSLDSPLGRHRAHDLGRDWRQLSPPSFPYPKCDRSRAPRARRRAGR